MTVVENVMVGAFQKTADRGGARGGRAGPRRASASPSARDAHARGLSTGQRKRLELARALATRPRLLLLDEVTGGVDQATVPGLVALVRELHAAGLALIVIEHNMRVIMEISQRVVALQLGEVIARCPAAVTSDDRVIDAYLGRDVCRLSPGGGPAGSAATSTCCSATTRCSGARGCASRRARSWRCSGRTAPASRR